MNAQRITHLLVGMIAGAVMVLAAGVVGATRADAAEQLDAGSSTFHAGVKVSGFSGVYPCASDEGEVSAQPNLPCAWDARHMGNGRGHSFVMRKDGTLTKVTHRRAHRLTAWAD